MDLVHASTEAPVTRCRYQDPESTQTLAEGLAEYRAANPELFDPDALTSRGELGELGRFFAAHDACHVLFGLDTSLADETLADTWTFFGTDVKWAELKSYFSSQEQRDFFKEFLSEVGYWKMITASLRALPRVFRAIWRSRSMRRKWALHHWKAHLDEPLADLRRDYGIRLV